MQEAIEAALIGGGVAAGVAIVGTISSAVTTTRTLRASRETAGEARLWAKTCEVYEQILADASFRQLVRDFKTTPFQLDQVRDAAAKAQLAQYLEARTNTIALQAGVRAYASDTVLALFEQARRAELDVSQVNEAWQAAAQQASPNPDALEVAAIQEFKPRLDQARAHADATIAALVDAARRELREGHLERRRWLLRLGRGRAR